MPGKPKTKIKAWAVVPNDPLVWWDINDIKVEQMNVVIYPLAIFRSRKMAQETKILAEKFDKKNKNSRFKTKVVPCEIKLLKTK